MLSISKGGIMVSAKLATAPPGAQSRALAWTVSSSFNAPGVGYTTFYEGCSGGDGSNTISIRDLFLNRLHNGLQARKDAKVNIHFDYGRGLVTEDSDSRAIRVVGKDAISRDFLAKQVSEVAAKIVEQTRALAERKLAPADITHPTAFYNSRHVQIEVPLEFGKELAAYMRDEFQKRNRGGGFMLADHVVKISEYGPYISIGAGFQGERYSAEFASELFEVSARRLHADALAFAQSLGVEPHSPIPGVKAPETRNEVIALKTPIEESIQREKADATRIERRIGLLRRTVYENAPKLRRLEAEDSALSELLSE